jgi:hypothetical protein
MLQLKTHRCLPTRWQFATDTLAGSKHFLLITSCCPPPQHTHTHIHTNALQLTACWLLHTSAHLLLLVDGDCCLHHFVSSCVGVPYASARAVRHTIQLLSECGHKALCTRVSNSMTEKTHEYSTDTDTDRWHWQTARWLWHASVRLSFAALLPNSLASNGQQAVLMLPGFQATCIPPTAVFHL